MTYFINDKQTLSRITFMYIHVLLNCSVSLTPDDPRWVGAWWVGLLFASALFLVISVPLFAYGSELPSNTSNYFAFTYILISFSNQILH